jgi:hypothetical protein
VGADEIEIDLPAHPVRRAAGILDFREKEVHAFACGQIESVRKKIRLNLLVRGEGFLGIAREHMNFMSPFRELVAEVIGNSTGSADGVRKEDICQHENSHEVTQLSHDSACDFIIR